MKFSFEGDFEELRELGFAFSGVKVEDTKEVVEVVQGAMENQEKNEISSADKLEIEEAEPFTDPTTGEYYEAFKDMCAAFDKLIDADKQDVVKEILTAYSSDGTYGGIPSGKWGKAEKEALAALKKKKRKTKAEALVQITVDQLIDKAAAFVKQNKDENRPKLRELLSSYGVENISSLEKSNYSDFDQALDKLKEKA